MINQTRTALAISLALASLPATVFAEETTPDNEDQLVVTATLADGRLVDLTPDVQYAVADGKTAAVLASGRVLPRSNGTSAVTAARVSSMKRLSDKDLPVRARTWTAKSA